MGSAAEGLGAVSDLSEHGVRPADRELLYDLGPLLWCGRKQHLPPPITTAQPTLGQSRRQPHAHATCPQRAPLSACSQLSLEVGLTRTHRPSDHCDKLDHPVDVLQVPAGKQLLHAGVAPAAKVDLAGRKSVSSNGQTVTGGEVLGRRVLQPTRRVHYLAIS